MLERHLPRLNQQQQQQQRGDTSVSDTRSLPQGMQQMQQMLQEGYSHLLPLCASVLVSQGMLINRLARLKRIDQVVPAGLSADDTAAAAAAAASDLSTAVMSHGLPTPACPSSSSSSLTAAQNAASCGGSSSSIRSSRSNTAAAAAALAAEQALLLSASRLQIAAPNWVSSIPDWGMLLQGVQQDTGHFSWTSKGLECPALFGSAPPAQMVKGSSSSSSKDSSDVSSSNSSSSVQQDNDMCTDMMLIAVRVLLYPLRPPC
jgi:hypothetical protein